MPIYLVRWPELSVSLVRAENEDDLLDTLDQVSNPDGCEWSIYDGPLFIDFSLPVKWRIEGERSEQPVRPEQIVIGDTGSVGQGVSQALEVSCASGDDGCEMAMEIVRRGFPKLQAAIDESWERGEDEAIPETELRSALHAELARVVRSSWRDAHLRDKNDPTSELARRMDLPVALAQKFVDAAEEEAGSEDAGSEPDWGDFGADAPLFVVSSHHAADCGDPPSIDGDEPHAYFGYFANEYGEQAVYTYDHITGKATVRMGDAGWQNAYRLVDGHIEGVKVSKAEAAWLDACWLASCGTRRDPPAMDNDSQNDA